MSTPIFAEDSNPLTLAPILSQTIEKIGENGDKYDYLMAFLITVMAEKGYRVASLYDENNNTWNKEMTCIPTNWKTTEGKTIYNVDFILYIRKEVRCKLIGIPVGDWMILNLLPPKGTSSCCQTRSITVNVSKHVNLHQENLSKFWHTKELALRFKDNLLAPLHGEMMMEIGIASPSLQGLPQELQAFIANMLDRRSRRNLEESIKNYSAFNNQCRPRLVSDNLSPHFSLRMNNNVM